MYKMMKRYLLAAFCICQFPAGLLAQVPADSSLLSASIDTLIANDLPHGSNVGISVYDLTARCPLYSYQADKLSRPASTMKLVTAITALSQSRADEPFRTEVWYRGTIEADTLHGDLYVVGGFDPEFGDRDLDSLAAAVARLPFTVLDGRVLGDVSMKDSLYWGSGWLWDDNPAPYQPYLSPLMLCKGTLTVTARPAAPGEPARLEAFPASTYYDLKNLTQSHTRSAGGFRVTRGWMTNSNEVVVRGNVDGVRSGTVNIFGSQDFFMQTFVDRLQALGMGLPAGYAYDELPHDSLCVRVAVHETPMQAVLTEMMKESDNLTAAAMLCRLGAQHTGHKYVSARDGLKAVRDLIKQLGLRPGHYKLADGCGLSHYDYLSPELLTAFLTYAYNRTDVFQKLYKALPVGGVDGTLKYRMQAGTPSHRNVHAKTGSYTAVNCLAGYLKAENGHWVAFAIMNQNVLSGRKARKFQDAVCDALIRYTGQ